MIERLPSSLLICALALSFGFLAAAQPETTPPQSGQPVREVRSTSVQEDLPPLPETPVDRFREMLKLPEPARERLLASRTEPQRQALMRKIREYELMSAVEREFRLRLVQLRWHLLSLMQTPLESRGRRLAAVPERDRDLIEQRLREWDRLTPELQKEFLENETTIHYFLRLQSSTPEQQQVLLQSFSQDRRSDLDKKMSRLKSLPAEKRLRMYQQFHHFFELDSQEQQKTLRTLSESERQQMEKSLQQFSELSNEQRRHCLDSFSKFVSMTPQERQQFLQNAQRWQMMSSPQRQVWRELVENVPGLPPLPPEFNMPPSPPTFPGDAVEVAPVPQ